MYAFNTCRNAEQNTHKEGFSQGELLVEHHECYRLHLAGHADLQCTAAEELSGWELVLDCALSELLSKLFPDDMHTNTHTHTQ